VSREGWREAARTCSYGFSLPDGGVLAALWNDGVAVDYDPGVPSTIILPGHAGWRAAAIDVLNGTEQELISRQQNGDLVVADFLLKDYPLILRLER
jgi:hypothetical protein